jgi:hypothetical protein
MKTRPPEHDSAATTAHRRSSVVAEEGEEDEAVLGVPSLETERWWWPGEGGKAMTEGA